MSEVNLNLTPTAEMPPVTTDTTGTTGTTGTTNTEGTSGILPSLAADQAATKAVGAAEGVATAQQGVEAAQAPALEAKAKELDAAAAADDAAALEAARVRQNYLERIGAANAAVDADTKKYENYQFHDYWSSLPTGKKIGAKIQIALGGFAAAFLGGPNRALEQINREADRDFEKQKLQLASRERLSTLRRQGVTDLYGAMQRDLAALEVKQGLAHKAIAAKAQAEAIRQGIPLEQAQTHVLVAGSLATAADKDLAAKQRYELHFQQEQAKKAETARQQSEQVTSAKAGKQAPVYDANGNVMGTTDAEQAHKVRGEIDTAQQAKALIDKLRASYDEKGVATDVDTIRERRGYQAELKALIPGLKGLNRLTHEEVELFGAVTGGNIDAFLGKEGGGTKALNRLSESLDQLVSSHLSSAGIKPTKGNVDRAISKGAAERAGAGADANGGIRKQITDAADWIARHPNDPKIPQVRAGIARLNQQLGAN